MGTSWLLMDAADVVLGGGSGAVLPTGDTLELVHVPASWSNTSFVLGSLTVPGAGAAAAGCFLDQALFGPLILPGVRAK